MIKNIAIEKICPNKDNPYKIREEEMEPLMDSIYQYGIVQPLLVAKIDDTDKYTIISGHRRYLAAVRLCLEEIPAKILEISKDEADILLVDSNLHRENISISEKAFAYKMKFDAIKRQGKRTDLTCGQVGHKSRDDVSDKESGRQIQRYISLTNLSEDLLNLVDEGRIAFTVAVELSRLKPPEQADLYETIQSEDCTPPLSQAQELKYYSMIYELDSDKIFEIMTKPKANQKEMFKMPMDRVREFSPNITTAQEAEEYITNACEYYARYLQRQRGRDR